MGADPQRPHDRPGDNSPVAGVVFSTGLWAFLAVPLAIVVAFACTC